MASIVNERWSPLSLLNPSLEQPPPAALLPTVKSSRRWLRGVAVVAAVGLVKQAASVAAKASTTEEQLARQSADTGSQASEARVLARQAQELAMETAAKLAATEAR